MVLGFINTIIILITRLNSGSSVKETITLSHVTSMNLGLFWLGWVGGGWGGWVGGGGEGQYSHYGQFKIILRESK